MWKEDRLTGKLNLTRFEKRKRVRADKRDVGLHATGALPEAYDVSFGVFEVGCEAHVYHGLFLLDYLASELLDALQGRVYVRDVYCDHCVLDGVLSFRHAAVDRSWLCGHSLLIGGCCANHVVFHSWVLVDLPSEGFLLEALGSFDVVGRYFEVYHFTGHIGHVRKKGENSE